MSCTLWGFERAEQHSRLLWTIVLYKKVMTAFDLFLNVPRTHDAIFWHCLPWCWSGLSTGNQESRSLQGLWQNLMEAGLFHLRFHSCADMMWKGVLRGALKSWFCSWSIQICPHEDPCCFVWTRIWWYLDPFGDFQYLQQFLWFLTPLCHQQNYWSWSVSLWWPSHWCRLGRAGDLKRILVVHHLVPQPERSVFHWRGQSETCFW